MARIKDITFESGSLTGTNGADSAVGTGISATSTSPLKGSWSALVNPVAATGYSQEDFTAVDTVYMSFYLLIGSNPDANFSVAQFRNQAAGTNGASIRIKTNGNLVLLDASNNAVGADYVLSASTTYRVGLRYTKGTGANSTIEMFVAVGDAAFGAADRSSTTSGGTIQIDRARVGATSTVTVTLRSDNIRIDDASMPTDDVAGGTTYNQSVNVTNGNSVTILKQVNKPISFTGVSVFTVAKQTAHVLSFSTASSVTITKQVGKILSMTVGNVVSDVRKQVNKNIPAVVNSTVSIGKAISKTLNFITSANVVIVAGLLFTKTIDVTLTTSVTIAKGINKVITAVVGNVMSMLRTKIQGVFSSMGRNIGAVSMQTKDTSTQSLTVEDDQIIDIDPTDDETI
jgi:hypothetical protein